MPEGARVGVLASGAGSDPQVRPPGARVGVLASGAGSDPQVRPPGARVGVLASGVGSNLQALLDRVHGRDGVEIVAVGSDKPAAQALDRARAAGVPAVGVFQAADHPDRRARDAAMADWLARAGVDLVVLAGYMQVLDPVFLGRFPNRVINVHPALLPAFAGLRSVEQAIEYGVKVVGVTVHFVDEGVDTGPVIAQRAVELEGAPTAAEVRRTLQPLEHDLLCATVRGIARGEVRIDPARPRHVVLDPPPR